jgi:predicted phage gp36 major capsid-like protein
VLRHDSPYLSRNYDSHLLLPETDHLSPRVKAALAESGGPVCGYTVPTEYARVVVRFGAQQP